MVPIASFRNVNTFRSCMNIPSIVNVEILWIIKWLYGSPPIRLTIVSRIVTKFENVIQSLSTHTFVVYVLSFISNTYHSNISVCLRLDHISYSTREGGIRDLLMTKVKYSLITCEQNLPPLYCVVIQVEGSTSHDCLLITTQLCILLNSNWIWSSMLVAQYY